MSLQELIEEIRKRDMSLDDYEVKVNRLCKAAETMRDALYRIDIIKEGFEEDLPRALDIAWMGMKEADQICAEGE